MMSYKKARVEYHPLGVVGAIVPWNYPFHNVFNPLTAAVMAGNAIVIKVRLLLPEIFESVLLFSHMHKGSSI